MSEDTHKVRTPYFPRYFVVKKMLEILPGIKKSSLMKMFYAINAQMGTPQNQINWTDPDKWIHERLSGENADLAKLIWEKSSYKVNPRYLRGAYLFINTHSLLDLDSVGVYQSNDKGIKFLKDNIKVLAEVDETEGIFQILSILSTKQNSKHGDIRPEWGEYLSEHSTFGSPSTIKSTLSHRLKNMMERKLVSRDGNLYNITEKGLEYLTKSPDPIKTPKRDLLRDLRSYNEKQLQELKNRLSDMHPFVFEHLVKDLLEAIGYEDVEVTKESGDKGVDVVATVQFGITTIKEVVQVKRHQSSIGRPILDQLRGALPYHKAIRGTIITLGSFSKGCKEAAIYPGAAPIGLIDGERLLELLAENEIGIKQRKALIYDIDEDFFTIPKGEDALE